MIRSARRTAGPAALALLTALGLTACSPSSSSASGDGGPSGTVTVFAAASLEESFTALGERFEKEHPGTEVTINIKR
ncbi:molybdate-binding protein, partial [Streptomyces albogriseolus]